MSDCSNASEQIESEDQAPTGLRIGIFVESSPDKGCFRQSLSTVERLVHNRVGSHEFVVFTPVEETRIELHKHGIEAVVYPRTAFRLLDRWSSTTVGAAVLGRLQRVGLRRVGRHLDALLDDYEIDLVLLNEDGEAALRIGDHPFIVTVWDLDHRDYPEFPQWHRARGFERQERLFTNTLQRAVGVIANSASGACRISHLYHVDPHRIVELPFLPSVTVRRHAAGHGVKTVDDVRRKYNLPELYIFYPAFYAFHKNHLYILEGLINLERRFGIILHAVFCGGSDPHPGARERLEEQVQALGLTRRVLFLGLVPDDDVPPLYEGAVALVIPSYFGPTNIPPLEAVVLGCPVICSDIAGCREQMKDAALYCDLRDVASLADQLASLRQDPLLRARLRDAARSLAVAISEIDYARRLAPMFDEYAYTSRRWAWPRKAK